MKEFIKALVSKNKSNIVPAEHNLFGHFVGEWDFEWIDCYGTAEERHIKGEWIFQWILEGTAIQDVFICPSRKERLTNYQPDAAYGTTVRMYNPDTLAWDILYTELEGAAVFKGFVDGKIAEAKAGSNGFGFDAVFVPDEGDGRTFAQMEAAEKDKISHRGRALEKFVKEIFAN